MHKKFVVHSKRGQQGPLTEMAVMQGIDEQLFVLTDYIYEEGSTDWILLMEHPLFAPKFIKQKTGPNFEIQNPLSADKMQSKEWFVLLEECQFVPFTLIEIVRMLQQKILFEHDFIFHEKFDSWKCIAEVEEFSPQNIQRLKGAEEMKTANVFFRRRFPRVPSGAQIIVHDKLNVIKGVAVEVSAGGAGIVVDSANLAPGQSLFVHFKPAGEIPPFNAVCEIVHKHVVGNSDGGSVKYGIKFVKIPQSTVDDIKDYSLRVG